MSETEALESMVGGEYKYGFTTDVEYEDFPTGINEDIIREISRRKDEPEWVLEFRLEAFEKWKQMEEPDWPNVEYEKPNFDEIQYYSSPKKENGEKPESLDDVDPQILETYEKLGIPLQEQKQLQGVAVDAVFDSESIFTTFKEKLADAGVIFCSISEAIQDHPELVKEYMGSVVPKGDNFYAALNSAVFSDGSFVYVPEDTVCPMDLSTYFRINNMQSGQFERTLIICEDNSHVSYLEGCTAPMYQENQLHAAVVELVALEDAEIKYSTIQNWYSGDEQGQGGIFNFVTKRGHCRGDNSKISWTQVETGSAITWKYPSVIMQGDGSIGEFFSVAVTNNRQQADTGTKMIHVGEDTKSTIISKGISAGESDNSYRGQVKISPRAENAQNYSVCDSMLIGQTCGAHTFPYIESANPTAKVEHEASTSRVGEDQIFYLQQRGMDEDDAISLIVNGFCKEVLQELPMEFAVEADKLLGIKLEGSVG
ncbi:Iron-regulated ABC transporter membrane component SufB [Fodinibius salinus]|uniref:Iron-regulated ABC transporter membrane component SufB n=1 Tax=Fodinibius salinus TaxID=860790 RepID=A0A5D3YMV7_9BACT|nr:Fe-S cluster assembly protein SufB [Fodinibius salinus]TYP95204.1 Iron-regulated ABC transporter membrane component SufB [Fodinibius salinus]